MAVDHQIRVTTGQNLLLQELERIDRLLRRKALSLRRHQPERGDQFHGLFVSDDEFSTLLKQPFGTESPLALGEDRPPNAPLDDSATEADAAWNYLRQRFCLSPLESDAILVSLLPEFDLRYERLFAYLQDDVTARRPTVDLILNLFCHDVEERLAQRAIFRPEAPLRRYRLLTAKAPSERHGGLLDLGLYVSEDLIAYLLGQDDDTLPRWLHRDETDEAEGTKLVATWYADWLASLPKGDNGGLHLCLVSEDGWLARNLARAVAAEYAAPLVRLDLPVGELNEEEVQERLALSCRESLLQDAPLYVALSDGGSEQGAPAGEWPSFLLSHPQPVIWRQRETLAPPVSGEELTILRQSLPPMDYRQRRALWHSVLADRVSPEAEMIDRVAARYRIYGEQIVRAGAMACQRAQQRDGNLRSLCFDDLSQAVRLLSDSRLGTLAQRIETRHRWDDLVLPADRRAQLREMCDHYTYRHVVYERWGFGAKMQRGRGLSALFAGPSGTGKTMAAEIVADELALVLYQIDLSGIVSKYIGETEKNLERIFRLAEHANAILLFDEADALFGKRSETKDAHDRYANIEISYLLQKIESYDGVVILTSNLSKNLDEAFMRRLQFTIEFPFPDREAREAIWRLTVPSEAPCANEIDYRLLAERFRLSGGSIRNAWINAAFLAAHEDGPITMRHLLWAIRREFQKLGKLVDEDQFLLDDAAPQTDLRERQEMAL